MAANDLTTIPANLSFLKNLVDLNLSANNFESDSILVSAPDLIKSLGLIPNLRSLNLSRNKFKALHQDAMVTSVD